MDPGLRRDDGREAAEPTKKWTGQWLRLRVSRKRRSRPPPAEPGAGLHRYRSHTCGALRAADIDKAVRLSGWVHRVRDHGGLLFIDLRDHYGITQVVADPDSPAFKTAESVRSEWVIRIDGQVRARPEGTVNAELPTGEVELFASEIEVLSAAKELPVPVFGEPDYPEDLRLQYRFLDLRRETLHRNIMQRLAITASIRKRMAEAGFFEFSTPILTASSPEGARATFSFPRAFTPASSTRCRRPRNSTSSCSWCRASTAISRSRRASATRTRAPTACRASSTSSTWR